MTAAESLPEYVVYGTWRQEESGKWYFEAADGARYVGRWAAVYNPYANPALGQSRFDWFRFDADGYMVTGWFRDENGDYYYLNETSDGTKGKMVTGWAWIPDKNNGSKCYYFNPVSDGTKGRMMKNTVVTGYELGENGEWTVNGIIQIQ